MPLKWDGKPVIGLVRTEVRSRLDRAGLECVRYAESHMPAQPTIGTGKRKRGLNPSAPGEFPKKVTQNLARSIDHEVYPDALGGRWGTNVKYGAYMELTTEYPRWRPWMSLTNAAMRSRLRQLLGGKL